MIANALFVTIVLLLALVFWLMGELKFFAHADDASKLRRVLDQRELTAEILSL
jgi:hypothetical protein